LETNMIRRKRSTLVLLGFIVVVIGDGYLFVRNLMPQVFDREAVNPAELAALETADLKAIPTGGGDWPQWLGPTRNGVAPAGPMRSDWSANPPRKLWERPCGGGHASLAVVDGKVFTMEFEADSSEESMVCRDAAGGQRLFAASSKADYSELDRTYANGPRAAPAIAFGNVFTVGAAGNARTLRLPTTLGALPDLIWDTKYPAPQWGFARSPLVIQDRVVIQSGMKGAMLTCFDAKSGTTLWTAPGDPDGYSSPAAGKLAGIDQIVAVGGSAMMGFQTSDGEKLWSVPWATQFQGNIATPLIVGNYVFISSAYAKGCALFHIVPAGDGCKAEQVYFRPGKVMQNHHANCIHRDGYLYGFDGDNLRCVDLRKGQQVPDWEGRNADNKPLGKGCLILAGDKLLGLTHEGDLFLADADPNEFKLRGHVRGVLTGPRAWALPVLVNGVLYLRDDVRIVAYDVR